MKNLLNLFLSTIFFYLTVYLSSCWEKDYEIPNKIVVQDTAFEPKETILKKDTSLTEVCTTKQIEWAPGNSESILLNPQEGVIFVGSVLDASSFQDGKFRPITGNRKSIKISVAGPIFNVQNISVQNPNQANVDSSINVMLTSTKISTEPSQTSINSYEIYESKQLQILFQAKYSGGTTKVEAGFNFNDQSIHSRYLLDITQVYYSVNMDAVGPKEFFASTPSDTSSFSPVYISSMKYGRRILVAIESKTSNQTTTANLKAQFAALAGSGSVSSDLFTAEFFKDNSIKILVMGGNPSNTFDLFKAVSKKEEIFEILHRDAIWSLNTTGFPLAYTVRNAYDNSVFNIVQYGQFTARSCVIKPVGEMTLNINEINKLCAFPTTPDRQFDGDPNVEFSLNLTSEANHIFAEILCNWTERGGDHTTARYYEAKRLIASIGGDSTIVSIESVKNLIGLPNDSRTNGHQPTTFPFDNATSPVRSVIILGDTPDDDDPWPGDCGTNHSQITSILFYPIKITAVKTK